MKRCPKCGEHKPAEAYYKKADKKDGLHSYCKACLAALRAANRDKINELGRAHYAANRDKIREQRKTLRAANRDKIRERDRAIDRNGISTLSASYIKKLLTKNTPLRAADIPDWLIDVKRAQLQLKRELHK